MAAEKTIHRRRLLPRFGLRTMLLLMATVAGSFVAWPWLEDVGVIAYCDYYDIGSKAKYRWPEIGASSCSKCHVVEKPGLRSWVTLPTKYKFRPFDSVGDRLTEEVP